MAPEHIIAAPDDGIRLDRWFKRHQPGFPHSMLEKHLRKGLIRLDGKKVKSSDRLSVGQKLVFPKLEFTPKKRARDKYNPTVEEVKELRSRVLYKDADIIAINKPHGLPVQGGSKVAKSLDDMLGALAFDKERPKLTHRLDRDTSGVLLLARHARAATQLTRQFADKTINKTYLALVHGTPHPLEGTIEETIEKLQDEEQGLERMAVSKDGQQSVTHYRVIESLAGQFALVELTPETGRTHQLRVHMQELGCPIVGDGKYGGRVTAGEAMAIQNRLHLHAWNIRFTYNRQPLNITAPLPPHMAETFAALEIEVPKS